MLYECLYDSGEKPVSVWYILWNRFLGWAMSISMALGIAVLMWMFGTLAVVGYVVDGKILFTLVILVALILAALFVIDCIPGVAMLGGFSKCEWILASLLLFSGVLTGLWYGVNILWTAG